MFIDHLVLTITDLTRTESFYTAIFGPPSYQTDHSVMYQIDQTMLFLQVPENVVPDRFNPHRVGLDHVAFNIPTVDELTDVARLLDAASIKHSGIHIDKHSGKEKIWLDDPDGIRLEFFIRA